VPSHQSNRNRIVPPPSPISSICTDKKGKIEGTPRIALKCRIHHPSPKTEQRDAHNLRNGSPRGNPSGASSPDSTKFSQPPEGESEKTRAGQLPSQIAHAFARDPHGQYEPPSQSRYHQRQHGRGGSSVGLKITPNFSFAGGGKNTLDAEEESIVCSKYTRRWWDSTWGVEAEKIAALNCR
jgi:hypothetical protein